MLAVFSCREIHGKHYLEADLDIHCYTPEHHTVQSLAALGVLLYPIGIPLSFMFLMLKYVSDGGTFSASVLFRAELNSPEVEWLDNKGLKDKSQLRGAFLASWWSGLISRAQWPCLGPCRALPRKCCAFRAILGFGLCPSALSSR
eukprot:1187163-Prorocentrum_minimum.AAC.3